MWCEARSDVDAILSFKFHFARNSVFYSNRLFRLEDGGHSYLKMNQQGFR